MSSDPVQITSTMLPTLESLKRPFLRIGGNVLSWTEAHVQSFSSLLSFYEQIFKKLITLNDIRLYPRLVEMALDDDWMQIMRELSKGLLFDDEYKYLLQNDRHRIIVDSWKYMTTLMDSIKTINSRNDKSGQSRTCHIITTVPTGQGLDQFDFLLAPGIGLVSVVLDSDDIECSIHEQVSCFLVLDAETNGFAQVLRLLKSSCSLSRTWFPTDVAVMESHLKFLVSRYLALFHKSPRQKEEQTAVISLYLEAPLP